MYLLISCVIWQRTCWRIWQRTCWDIYCDI